MATINSSLAINTVLSGRYAIQRVIGAGGFGITYYATHLHLGTPVAIKEFFLSGKCVRCEDQRTVAYQDLQPQLFEKYRQRFREEAVTLSQLSNPHVVRVQDVFDENGTTYIVMDYIVGQTLQQMVQQRGALSYDEAVNYIGQLCEAVEHIHAHHILHRDIKPDNIIVNPQNQIVLIDFGSARSFVHDHTQQHTAMLTPGYAPCEQYSTTSRKGNYTDLYAVGGTFYFLLTAQRPAPAVDRLEEDTLVPPRNLNPAIPESVNSTILHAMRLKPAERYQSVAEFRRDLFGGDPEISSPNPSTPPTKLVPPTNHVSPEQPSNSWVWILVALLGVVTLVAVIFLLSRPKQDNSYVPYDEPGYEEPVEPVYEVPDPHSMAGYDPDLSERELTGKDLQSKSTDELSIMRNSVYARYGFRFGKENLISYFNSLDWYQPHVDDQEVVFNQMNSYEQHNVKFIRKYEKALKEIASRNLSFYMEGITAGYYSEIRFDGNRREGQFQQHIDDYNVTYRTLRLHSFDGSNLELEAYDTNGQYVSMFRGTVDEYQSSYIGTITNTDGNSISFEVYAPDAGEDY